MIRFGETIKAYEASESLQVDSLTLIPLVLAGWCRYLMGVDDEGKPFEQSSDPRLDEVKKYVADVRLGEDADEHPMDVHPMDVHKVLQPILSDETIFAVNLYDAGLGEKVEGMFAELTAGTGAVRATLLKYTA